MANINLEPDAILREFWIPTYILVPESRAEIVGDIPSCPVLVFINSKSGGQLGGDLLVTYRSLLNKHQIFDLGEEAPDVILRRLYLNLETLKLNGDQFAPKLEEKLRIIVAGGDGTAGWLLGVVSDLKLSRPPPIATVPLGTGNNLPFAFGWAVNGYLISPILVSVCALKYEKSLRTAFDYLAVGKKNPGTDRDSVLSFLQQVMKAKEMMIDSWHILMRMKAPSQGSCDPIAPPELPHSAPLELPHSLHAFQRVSSTDELNVVMI